MKAHEISVVKEKPFRKDYIFRTFFRIFSTAFLGPRRLGALPRYHKFPKAAAVVKKQFRKAAEKLCKNLSFYERLSKTFLWLRNRFPKHIYPLRKILRNRFLLFIKNFRKIYSFRNNFFLTALKMPSQM
jgi:hypothetical protein